MRKGRLPFLATGPFFLLLSCGTSTAPDSEQSRRLDNAEEMLNSAPAELSKVDSGDIEEAERNAP